MKKKLALLLAAAAALGAGAAYAAQQGSGEPARYWITADTASGMAAAMAGGASGAADPAAMMRAMMGGQSGHAHLLNLKLATGRNAAQPAAEHLPPAGLRAGESLPLVTPRNAPAGEAPDPVLPGNMERPRGRILIYWGCGERAGAGQPAVLDFASLTAGRVPAAFRAVETGSLNPPAPGRGGTYGEWPNERARSQVPPGGSLAGAHVVRGNYTPEIRFTVAPQQDFLAPVRLTASEAAGSGAVPLSWAPVPGAKGWVATVVGAGENGDMVMWSSSAREAMPMALAMQHLSDADIARLVRERVLLPGDATQCTVPAEVASAGEGAMLTLAAFGGEANFSHPARPANAPASWRPEWTVKLLRKSSHAGLLGMDMGAMFGEAEEADEEEAEVEREAKPEGVRGRLRRGLGRILGQ